MISLTKINNVVVTKNHLEKAYEFLKDVGKKKFEAVALFAGDENGSTFFIKEVILPKQSGYILEQGLMYAVDGNELHRINVWLYENNMKLIAQIHSHPTKAYHSKADDRFPIIDTYGGISIVVPYFATGEMNIYDWAIYRFLDKSWIKLSNKKVKSLFTII